MRIFERSPASQLRLQILDTRVAAVLDIIAAQFQERLTCSYLASRVNLSESRLEALFRQTGITIHQALKVRRMTTAAALLRSTNLLVKEVAGRSGLQDCSHFVRDFRELYGLVQPNTAVLFREHREPEERLPQIRTNYKRFRQSI